MDNIKSSTLSASKLSTTTTTTTTATTTTRGVDLDVVVSWAKCGLKFAEVWGREVVGGIEKGKTNAAKGR